MNPNWEKLETLRDEVKLKLHLAGMEARDEFDRIEAQLPDIQTTIDDVIRRLEKLRASLETK